MTLPLPTRHIEGRSHSIYALPPDVGGGETAEEILYRQRALLVTHFGSLASAVRAIACLLDAGHLIGVPPPHPGAIVNLLVAAQQMDQR